MVECVVDRQGTRTRNLLGTIPGTRAETVILYSFQSRMETCFDGYRNRGRAMSYYGNLLRGAIAEVYYRREVPDGLAPAGGSPEEAAIAWTRPRQMDGTPASGDMVHAMARCVTLRRPGEVASLLASEPLSAAERTALASLQSEMAACLDAGVELAASRQSLRGLLAEAALHYAHARRNGFAWVSEAR